MSKLVEMAETDNKLNLGKVVSERKRTSRGNGKNSAHPEYILGKAKFLNSSKRGSRDIFVNNQTHFKEYLYKCEKLFDNGASELIIHGFGAALSKAINLALRLKEIHNGCLDLDIKTSTEHMYNCLKSFSDDLNDEVNNRQISAIHIRIFRKIPLTALRIPE